MKSFYRTFIIVSLIYVLIIGGLNLYLSNNLEDQGSNIHNVEINRLADIIKNDGLENINLDEWDHITNISSLINTEPFKEEDTNNALLAAEFFKDNSSDYKILLINNTFYRFDYNARSKADINEILIIVNISMSLIVLVTLIILLFVWKNLVKPFEEIKNVPYELSKGNLSVGLKENRNKFFGKFVWGLDMLREHLEKQKEKEHNLLREKKTLVLSISHDIKTPLSAIKLYSSALIKDLYKDDGKQKEAAKSINLHADEIENYVSEIIKASSDDLINLQVTNSDHYLDLLIRKTKEYYREKLSLLNIDFNIGQYRNCLLSIDFDRAIEVLQNIIENAVKYGDGKYISIDISEEEGYQLITTTNSGSSLSPSELQYIFDSFWRGSNVKNNAGSGLGLYICRQLMLAMKGDIYAQTNDGEFKVTLVFKMS